MVYNLAGLFGISFSIEQALRTLMGNILALIYSLIEYLYSVFIYLSKAQILDNDFIQSIYSKVGMILGIFMIFKLMFSLIQSLIDPDKFTDKKNGFASIIFRTVISIVLLGVTPAIFREAFKIQNMIVGGENNDNVIYKLVSGNSSVGNLDNMGRVIASDLYFSFFTDEEEPKLIGNVVDITEYIDPSELEGMQYDRFVDEDYEYLVNSVRNSKMSFQDTVSYLALKSSVTEQYVIEFNWLLLLVTGCFVAYILAMYCVQVAIRVVQLAYLQLIAPVPILSYIADPEGTFKKWVNQCISTFLDLFLRLAIIYFIVTLIGDVLTQFSIAGGVIFESTGIPRDQWFTLAIVKIFIIIGLLLFAKKVPDLLKDLFPNLGGGVGKFSFGLNPKKEVFEPLKQATGPIGKLATNSVRWAGGKAIAPIKRTIETAKNNRKARIEGNAEANENRRRYNRGEALYNAYEGSGKDFADAFSGDFAVSYNELKEAKKNAGKMENIFNAASDELKEARKSGDVIRLANAQEAYDKANKNKRDADKLVEEAKKRHETNRKRFTKQAQMEDDHDYYVNRRAITGLNSGATNQQNNSGQGNVNANSNQGSSSFNTSPVTTSTSQSSNSSSNSNYHYASQSDYDERIEFATEKLQDLATNGASQEEIDAQLKTLQTLEKGKEYSASVDRASAENADAADEQFKDGWMSQGGADDSDNW